MPILRSISTTCCAAVCGCAICFAHSAACQSAPNPSTSSDPNSLLLSAADANGAPSANAKPWHSKISFTLNDWYGKPEVQGTFEEFWAAPDKFKLVYATSSFSQVEYTTPAGIRRTGSPDSAPPEITHIVEQFLHPILFDRASTGNVKLQAHELKLGTTKLACVTTASNSPSDFDSTRNATYCLDDAAPILRLTLKGNNGFQRTIRNSIVKFQDHYVPQTVEWLWVNPGERAGRTEVSSKLDAIELLNPADEGQFTPPPDAKPPAREIDLDEKATHSQLLQTTPPAYPPIAKAAHVTGDVVIALMVRTDGHVSGLRLVSGPAMLQQAALDAVKKWIFKPFENQGDLVEVNTVTTVRFRLTP